MEVHQFKLCSVLVGYGGNDGGMDGRLGTPWCTRCRVRVYRGSAEFLWSVSSLRYVFQYYVGNGSRG